VSPLDRTGAAAGDHPLDELAAYAVDAVDDDHERREIEAHLAACPSCRQQLAAHEEVLSRMIGDERPPAAVWDRISQQTIGPADAPGPRPVDMPGEGPGDVVPLVAPRPPRHLRDRGSGGASRRRLVGALVAAAAVVVALGVGTLVWGGATGDDSPTTTELVAPELPVGVIVAADGTEVARVGADSRGSFVEMMEPMDDLPVDRTYQLWSLDGADPVSIGLLGTGAERMARVSLPEGTTSVAISDEPAGGSPAPTGLIAGTGDLALPA
jgi:hypothetical protein